MALNLSHSDKIRNGLILLHQERILMQKEKVDLTFDISPEHGAFKGTKEGTAFLTNQRVIFINKKSSDVMKSFSMPFFYMKNVDIKQPIFGANALTGVIKAQPGGGLDTHAKADFRMVFKTGGAIEFGQLLLRVATKAPTVPPPAPGQSAVPQPTAAYSNTYPANGYPAPMPGAQYPPPQQPPMGAYGYPGQTAYPAYPPGAQPYEQPPPYSDAMMNPSAPPPPGPAYYNPNDPQYVYMTQNQPSTIPTAPPPAYSEKPKTD
ncbi:WW domain-binding protein 2-like [Asterias amurensis]|uniref:WW domain-binding protein 2-like n=1 Tax=Asterias amurensis TaxID=7602 RepID=UPI003AB8C4A9